MVYCDLRDNLREQKTFYNHKTCCSTRKTVAWKTKKITFCRRAQNAGSMAAAFDVIRKIDCQMCPEFSKKMT